MKLSKGLIGLIITVVAIVIVVAYIIVAYNGLVTAEQRVESQWAQVENQYQRRIDLIPDLINITSQYTQFERSTIENVTALRTQWLSDLTSAEKINTSLAMDNNISMIIAAYYSAENYPVLSSIQLVSDLMYELEGTVNRIAVERMVYNEEVRDYNTMVAKFPRSLIAGMFGFEKKPYYNPLDISP